MKFTSLYVLVFLFFSCKKSTESSTVGTITGTVKAYDLYGNQVSSFADINIELTPNNNPQQSGTVNLNGEYRFENVPFGPTIIRVKKPGYGYTDSVEFTHTQTQDTLSNIVLVQELPFSLFQNVTYYQNGILNYRYTYNYSTTDTYMVTQYFCFGKDSTVSINNLNLFWASGASMNASYINGFSGGSSTFKYADFATAGFKKGDNVYVVAYSQIPKLSEAYYNLNNNYKILSYKLENRSNVTSFILGD